jgi:hypothetical protein
MSEIKTFVFVNRRKYVHVSFLRKKQSEKQREYFKWFFSWQKERLDLLNEIKEMRLLLEKEKRIAVASKNETDPSIIFQQGVEHATLIIERNLEKKDMRISALENQINKLKQEIANSGL